MRTANVQFTVMKTEGYGFESHLGGDTSAEQLNGQSITTKNASSIEKGLIIDFSQTSNPATCNKGNTHHRKDVCAVRRNKTKYCAGGAKVAHLAHYQKTTFESFARNHALAGE